MTRSYFSDEVIDAAKVEQEWRSDHQSFTRFIGLYVGIGLLGLLLLPLAAFGQKPYCGVERMPIKTLTDSIPVDVHHVTTSSVADLRALKPPKWGDTEPRTEAETHVYRVPAWIIGYKFEDNTGKKKGDGDFHVVIATPGKTSETMIFEIPDPLCGRPEMADKFGELRQFIASLGKKPSPKFYTLPKPVPVTVTGVLFFDKIHGQTGVAPNGIELHPALSISK